jgi:hypothetical protein
VTAEPTVLELLADCLRAQGARRVFRAPGSEIPTVPGLTEVEVPGDEVAAVLADADGRLAGGSGTGPGVALLAGRRLRLSSQPGQHVDAQQVTDPSSLPAAVAGWSLGEVHAAVELDLFVDLFAPAPPGLEALALDATSDQLITLSPTLADFRTVLLVGPGVRRAGQAAAVAEAARRTGALVVTTPGAVGTLALDDPAWGGVVGLQADDAALSGLAEAELIIAAGVDPTEAVDLVPDGAQLLDVEPWHLALMALHWPDPAEGPRSSELVRRLDELAAPPPDPSLPLSPVRATVEVSEAGVDGGILAADAGPAGLWLARGLAPSAATVVVPARPARGFATAAALISGLDGRPAVAVTTAPVDPLTEALLDLAASLDVGLVLEVWGGEASWASPDEHLRRLGAAVAATGVHRLAVPVELAATRVLVEVAGSVVAWSRGE